MEGRVTGRQGQTMGQTQTQVHTGRCDHGDEGKIRREKRAYRASFLETAIHGKVEEAGAAKKLRGAAGGR